MRKATVFGAMFIAATLISGEASAATTSSYSSFLCKLIPSKSLRVKFGCEKDSSGNTGSGNTGSGNTGSGNTGSGNTGSGGTGSGGTGSGGTGSGGTGSGNTGSGGGTTTPPAKSYSASLSWTIPSARENGQALSLSELSGYEVYYTTDSSSATSGKVVKISGGSKSSYVVSELPAGTYYFAISAIDANGLKSALSSMVSAKVGP